METEIWKDIPGYEGLYQASNLGNVLSPDKKSITGKNLKGKKLKYFIVKGGYPSIKLNGNGKIRKCMKISRLVASAFLGLDLNDNSIFVCHKDDNPLNSKLDNLFLGTSYDNMHDMIDKGRSKCGEYKKIAVSQFTLSGDLLNEFNSASDASRKTGLNVSHLLRCCNEQKYHKTAGGFIWKFKTTG